MNQKRKRIKWLLILEGIVFYFALLNIISHVRGPIPYQIEETTPLVEMEEFQPFFDMGAVVTEKALPIINVSEGVAAGYQTEVLLIDVDAINIQFQVNCPADEAGSILHVDLYNAEAEYDNPEQEQEITLQEGWNEIQFDLLKGDQAPDTAYLRLFTLNAVNYQIENMEIYRKTPLPKVTNPMVAAAVVTGMLLLGTIGYRVLKFREDV